MVQVGGKPLIAWSIEAAQEARRLSHFVVSTEDSEIKKVAGRWGAAVIDRPVRLATDRASTWAVLRQVLSKFFADVVVLLQPTSPVRRPGLIDFCIDQFFRKQADNLATGFDCFFKPYGTYSARRQDLKGFFYDDGNVYVVKSELIRADKRVGRRSLKVLTSREENVEIDEEFDLWLADKILRSRRSQGPFSGRSPLPSVRF